MTLWKKAVALLLAAAMMVAVGTRGTFHGGQFLGCGGPLGQAEIEKAVATGWVDGYPDGTFKPEKDHHPGRVHQNDTGRHPLDPWPARRWRG